jgi:transposase
MEDGFEGYVGIDWAQDEHQVAVVGRGGEELASRKFAHSAEELAALAAWLVSTIGVAAEKIAIGTELVRGAIVETLIESGFAVFVVHPKQLDRFRDRLHPAGSKNDRLDALVLANAVRTDANHLTQLHIEDKHTVLLRELTRRRAQTVGDLVAKSSELRSVLLRYFPAHLRLPGEITSQWRLKVLELVPTPEAAARVRKAQVTSVLRKNRGTHVDANAVLATLRVAPFRLAPGTVEAAHRSALRLVEQVDLFKRQVRALDQEIEQLLDEMERAATPGKGERSSAEAIVRSWQGAGSIVAATLLAEAPQALRDGDYQRLRRLCGVAPITRQSGKSRLVVMRRACSPQLRDAAYHWARCAMQRPGRYRERYTQQRGRGVEHNTALRVLADRLLRDLCVAIRNGELYRPNHAALAA